MRVIFYKDIPCKLCKRVDVEHAANHVCRSCARREQRRKAAKEKKESLKAS